MIVDSLKNASRYFGLGDGVKKGLEFLLAHDISKLEERKYDVDGAKSWATILRRTTKPENEILFETHRKYIDIQMGIEGEEWFGYTPEEALKNSKEYDSERDIQYHDGEGFFFKLERDQFVLFYPEDGHKPETAMNEPSEIRKIVVKIPV